MIHKDRGSVVVILVVCFILGLTPQVFSQEIEFHFNPLDGIAYLETVKTTKVKDMGLLGKQSDVGKTTAKVSITKTPSGYEVVVTPLSMTMARNGQVVNSPTTPVLLDTVVRYELDADGHLLAIRGYETLVERMQQVIPQAAAQSLSAVFSEEALVNKETAEWNARIGSYIGRRVKIGEVVHATEEFELPTGETVVFYSATKFIRPVAQLPVTRCVSSP